MAKCLFFRALIRHSLEFSYVCMKGLGDIFLKILENLESAERAKRAESVKLAKAESVEPCKALRRAWRSKIALSKILKSLSCLVFASWG